MNEVARSEGKCGSCVPENESQPKTKVLGHACLLCIILLKKKKNIKNSNLRLPHSSRFFVATNCVEA